MCFLPSNKTNRWYFLCLPELVRDEVSRCIDCVVVHINRYIEHFPVFVFLPNVVLKLFLEINGPLGHTEAKLLHRLYSKEHWVRTFDCSLDKKSTTMNLLNTLWFWWISDDLIMVPRTEWFEMIHDILIRHVGSVKFLIEYDSGVILIHCHDCCRIIGKSKVQPSPKKLCTLWNTVNLRVAIEYLSFHSSSPFSECIDLPESLILFP